MCVHATSLEPNIVSGVEEPSTPVIKLEQAGRKPLKGSGYERERACSDSKLHVWLWLGTH